MVLRSRSAAFVVLIALVFAAFLFPYAASAFFVNIANASIAHAIALPEDAPARTLNARSAVAALGQASSLVLLPRSALARARAALAQADVRTANNEFAAIAPSDALTEFIAGQVAWQAQDVEAALAHWRRAGAIEFYMQRARRSTDEHQWQSAVAYAEIATRISPRNAEAHYILADALSNQVPIDPVVYDELDKALDLSTDVEFRSIVLSRRGELLAAAGKWDDALAAFAAASEIAPRDARPRTDRALILLEKVPGTRDQAVALLVQVTNDSPWYVAAYLALASDAANSGDWAASQKWLEEGLARSPNDARLLVRLGDLYVKQQRLQEARSAFARALEYETHADDLQSIARRLAELNAQ